MTTKTTEQKRIDTKLNREWIVERIESIETFSRLLDLAYDGIDVGAEEWYAEGFKDVERLAKKHNVTTDMASYALSVFSPRCSVSRASRLADAWLSNPNEKPAGCMGSVYATAMKYRDELRLNGPKTNAFLNSIKTAGMSDCVESSLCLDTHMVNAIGCGMTVPDCEYRKFKLQCGVVKSYLTTSQPS